MIKDKIVLPFVGAGQSEDSKPKTIQRKKLEQTATALPLCAASSVWANKRALLCSQQQHYGRGWEGGDNAAGTKSPKVARTAVSSEK